MRLLHAVLVVPLLAVPLRAQTLADAKTCERAIMGGAAERAALTKLAGTRPPTPVALFAKGCLSVVAAQWDSAAAQFNAAAAANPRSSATWLWVANLTGRQARTATSDSARRRLAPLIRDTYLKAVALDAANIDAREALLRFYLEVPPDLGGDRARAAEQAAAIARLDAYRGLGARIAVADVAHDRVGLERLLTQATTQFPDSALGWVNLSAMQADGQRPLEAYATIARWQKRGTHRMYALFATGRTAAVTGNQPERGIQALQAFLRGPRSPLDPPVANAHFRLGQIYEWQKNTVEARASYRRALEANPRMRDAQMALDRLK